MSAVSSWFGPSARPLFGWAHVPADGSATGAVVLCPPLARELAATQVCYRTVADRLADAGMLAIRFDYDGTGDSAGDDADPDRVRSWVASIGHAVAFARRCGVATVSLLGMRIGGPLAAVAAAGLDIDALVLWDPISGRPFVRGESALRRLRFDEPPASGEVTELPGFVFGTDTVAALGALSVPAAARPPARVLLLTRPGQTPHTELTEAVGTTPERADALGQEQMLEVEPGQRRTPEETIDQVVAWLSSGPVADRATVSVPRQDAALVPVGDGFVTERAVRLGPAGLFAIAAEPERSSDAPTVLMLNAGTDWHVGPNRLWVELSRRWAAAGVRCVRLDESGLGDSPPRPGNAANVVRAPDAFDDVAEAAAAVSPEDPGNVVLLGLCSGGYQALENALAGAVRGVYAINPVLHFNPPELEWGPMDPRRRICWPASNLALTYRWLLTEPVRRRLRTAIWRVVHLFNRDHDRAATTWLDELRRDKVEVLVVCSEDEARPFGAAIETAPAPERGQDPIRIDVVSGLDGSLMPSGQRAEVSRRLTEHLFAHFAPDPMRSLSTPR
jgi:alpha-beta hydrolase superfamily lysophospholipase